MRVMSGRRLHASHSAFPWRALGLWALAALLLAGSLDLHPADEGAEPFAGGELYFPAAAHPEQPEHLETSPSAERPHCAACLNRYQGGAAGLPRPLAQAAPARRERLRLLPFSLPFEVARGSARGRAPPLS
jgi:hypothetical protein